MVESLIRMPPQIFTAQELASLERNGLSRAPVVGQNPAVPTSIADIWPPGNIRSWLQVGEPLVAVSTDANDTVLGSGARTIQVTGLDDNGLPLSESIDMNGTTDTLATTGVFFRTNSAIVTSVGIYGGVNLGDISISTTGGTPQAFISAGVGQENQSHYTIGAGLQALAFNVSVFTDAPQESTARILLRQDAANLTTLSPSIAIFTFPGLQGADTIPVIPPFRLLPLTDIWVDAQTDAGTAVIGCTYSLMLAPL